MRRIDDGRRKAAGKITIYINEALRLKGSNHVGWSQIRISKGATPHCQNQPDRLDLSQGPRSGKERTLPMFMGLLAIKQFAASRYDFLHRALPYRRRDILRLRVYSLTPLCYDA
jgi:hypothetical protein